MHYILNNLKAPHNQYDVFSGVSVGAINALGYSRFAKGEEKAADEEMMGLWAKLTNGDIYHGWPQSARDPVHGILYESGFFDNSPLNHLMTGLLEQRNVKKHVIVSSTDVETGTYRHFQLLDEDPAHPIDIAFKVNAVQASASVPFMFPPKHLNVAGKQHIQMDGGTTWNSNLVSGVN